MQVSCPNAGCDAVYELGDDHHGRRFECRKCKAVLFVEDDGTLRLDKPVNKPSPGRVPPQVQESITVTNPPGKGSSDRVPWLPKGVQPFLSLGLVALFGLGAFLAVVFTFFPLIDHAKYERKKAEIESGDAKEDRLFKDLEEEIKKQNYDEKKADDLRQLRKDDNSKWVTARKKLLIEEEELRIGEKRSTYWYLWGAMLGYICLATASLGFTVFGESRTTRVVGAIIVTAIVLLIFLSFLHNETQPPKDGKLLTRLMPWL